MKGIKLSLIAFAVMFATAGAFATAGTDGQQPCDQRPIELQCDPLEPVFCCIEDETCHQGEWQEP